MSDSDQTRGRAWLTPRVALAAAIAVFAVTVATPSTAQAGHGSWHRDQHAAESGSCCIEVWAHVNCSTGCWSHYVSVKKGFYNYSNTCYDTQGCASPTRSYNTPVTVHSDHQSQDEPYCGGHGCFSRGLDVFYG